MYIKRLAEVVFRPGSSARRPAAHRHRLFPRRSAYTTVGRRQPQPTTVPPATRQPERAAAARRPSLATTWTSGRPANMPPPRSTTFWSGDHHQHIARFLETVDSRVIFLENVEIRHERKPRRSLAASLSAVLRRCATAAKSNAPTAMPKSNSPTPSTSQASLAERLDGGRMLGAAGS